MNMALVGGFYELQEQIGVGGMGVVYKAVDTRTGTLVAVKSLKSEILSDDPAALERFLREAEALRQLNHPHIVKVLETIEEDDQHYIVLEYMAAGSLRDLLAVESRLPVERVLEIALDLSDALIRAHRLQIIHRDIKPANILLSEDGAPYLTDFGVARMNAKERVTQSGMAVGTLDYLAPEVLRGGAIDARTDIWAFGVLLFEMLAGERPFVGDSTGQLLTAILEQPPRNLNDIRSDVPPALIDLIHRMLSKNPDARISSARQVGAELEGILAGGDTPPLIPVKISQATRNDLEATTSAPTITPSGIRYTPPSVASTLETSPSPTSRPARTIPLTLLAAIIFLVLVVGGVLFVLSRPSPTAEANSLTMIPTVAPVEAVEYMVLVAQPEPLRNPAPRDVGRYIADDLRRNMETNAPFSLIRIREYQGVITSDEQAQQVAAASGAAVIIWGSYTDQDVTLNMQVGSLTVFPYMKFDHAFLERTLNLRLRMTDERVQSVAFPLLAVMVALQTAGNEFLAVHLASGMGVLVQGDDVEILDDRISSDFARSMMNTVQAREVALEPLNRALRADPSNGLLYALRGAIYFQAGDFTTALVDLQTAESLAPAGWLFPTYVRSGIASRQGDINTAIAELSKVVAGLPDEWYPIYMRGAYSFLSGDYAQAESDIEAAIALEPITSWPYFVATGLALRDGRLQDAAALTSAALNDFPDVSLGTRMIEFAYGESIPDDFYQLFNLTTKLFFFKRYTEVIEDSQVSVEAGTKLPEIYFARGAAYYCLGDWDNAEATFTEGLALDPDNVTMYMLRGAARKELNDLPGALADITEVQRRSQDALLQSYLAAGLRGEQLTCDDFLAAPVAEVTPET
jgi:serine/threonine protein kinase/tetratricopeptide (TPR) repeat protein